MAEWRSRVVVLVLVLLCVSLCCTQNASHQSVVFGTIRDNRQENGGEEGGINRHMLEANREAYQGLSRTTAPPTSTTQQLEAIPPGVPNPKDVECFVTTVQRQGGLCRQLGERNGSSLYYCQRGEFTEMQPECGTIVRARTARVSRGSPEARTPRGQN